ncbi:SpoIID/LytB domain-containing protein [Anoxynatronum buryatiense]|uniref:SpoIID/LytB domain protein n=1 Tax=Anoxynatronum buryatiense TaxID=489973 RepID=A0AA46AIH1_9CLOT|nr:SpoIID/LytB domain-containing protein [Anoxynatronum buryatiense]SMP49925.1 SpoIID/LytB domain protein [Anoxynatronum buryatiense]
MRAFHYRSSSTKGKCLIMTISMIVILTIMLLMTNISHAMTVGTEIGEVLSTDILAVIDNKSIPSLNINGYTAIIVEDLRAYGFNVSWNEQERTLHVNRNSAQSITGKPYEVSQTEPGKRLYPVLFTDIKTYLDGIEVVSFNIDGQTAIYFNQLKNYGNVGWSEQARVASLEFPEPLLETSITQNDNKTETVTTVTRHSTQLDPEESYSYHQPFDKSDIPKYIDVGINFGETALSRIQVTTGDGFVIGEFAGDQFNPQIRIQDTNQLQLVRDDNYYIGTDGWIQTLEKAQEFLQELRLSGVTGLIARDMHGWNVYVGPYQTASDADRDIIKLEVDSVLWHVVAADSRRIRISSSSGNPIIVYSSETPLHIISESNNPDQSLVQIGQAKYRGSVTAIRKPFENVTVINRLPIEQYLYGVVPREMPHSWSLEALKAQAVAARGFAIANLGKYRDLGFDVCTTVNSQVYGGYTSEQSSTNQAVDQTTGIVMTYQGELVIPYYHSNSGGRTESSENVWREAVPYARGVDDSYSLNAPHASWEVSMTYPELEQAMRNNQMNIGEVENVYIDEMTENGRVSKLIVVGSQGIQELIKQENRWVFGLKSHYFNIQLNNQSVIFAGKGYGHGVGMSQYGAKSMAEAGYSWQQILQHYYSGVHIE